MKLVVAARVGLSNKNKIEHKASLQKVLSDFEMFYDSQSNADPYPPSNISDGLFGYYQIVKTPAVIFWNPISATDTVKLFKYEDLFDQNGFLRDKLNEQVMAFYQN